MNKNLRYLWLFLGAVLTLLIGGKWNLPLAAWIAPVFFIRFFRESDKADAVFVALAAGPFRHRSEQADTRTGGNAASSSAGAPGPARNPMK